MDLAQAHFYQKLDLKEQEKHILHEEIDCHLKMKHKKEKKVIKRREKYAIEVKLKDQLDMERAQVKDVR